MRLALIFTDKNYMKLQEQLISPNLKYTSLKHIVGLPKLPRVLKKSNNARQSMAESGEKFDIALI